MATFGVFLAVKPESDTLSAEEKETTFSGEKDLS
jgi:hypothetical protein